MKNNSTNQFVALCKIASQNDWCWKIFCTTCGHGEFKVAFSKIMRNQHPDDKTFWPYGKKNHPLSKEIDNYRDFFGYASNTTQIRLANIIATAKVVDIQAVAKFPDWLGYIGLVIHHCQNRESRTIISNAFLPQFIKMVKNDNEIRKYLQEKLLNHEILSINDLSRIENKIVNLKNPPLPLISDIL